MMVGIQPIHEWFGLTYSNYLVLPRSILQSMPVDWQDRFVSCLREADEAVSGMGDMPDQYTVQARDGAGRFIHDDSSDYSRGRRKIALNGQ